MAERWDYFHYRDGHKSDLLRLGSMVLDFRNPQDRRPFRHPPWSDTECAQWMSSDTRSEVCLLFKTSNGWSVSGGVENLAKLGRSTSEDDYTIVTGKTGLKEELIDPELYFKQVILKDTEAVLWLSSRLSIASRLQFLKKMFARLDIWLLTGRYLVNDAAARSIIHNSRSASGEGVIPIPDPSGITELLNLKPSVSFSFDQLIMRQAGATIHGEHIWAAKYQKITSAVKLIQPGQPFPLSSVQLLNTFSTMRGGDKHVIELGLCGPSNASDSEEAETHSEDAWQKFDAEVEELLSLV